MRLAGWDLSVQGRVAPKATLLLYLYLVEVPPGEEHTIVVNARGATNHKSGAARSDRCARVF